MIKWIPVEKEPVPANKPHLIIRYEMPDVGSVFNEFVETDEQGRIFYYQLTDEPICMAGLRITHWAEVNEP